MTELYVNAHDSQYGAGASVRTRHQGCTWTSAGNGVDASTGGRKNPTPDQVLALVKPSEETNPTTPGWSLQDVDLAMSRLGVPFEVRTGDGWAALKAARAARQYVIVQGVSAVFSDRICSGAFDGPHCVGVHPKDDSEGRWRGDDPICTGARYYGETTLRRYAEAFNGSISFGVFTDPVPFIEQPHVVASASTPSERNVMLTYATGVATTRRLVLAKGQPLFRHPGGPRVTAMSAEAGVGFVGAAGAGWSAVVIRTAVPYRDRKSRPTVLYVPRKAGVLS